MNMKKTIAAIAAGAMAVSAMASSVSAIELADKVLSYNLVANLKNDTKGVVTISTSIGGIKLGAGKNLGVYVKVPAGMEVRSITVSGNYNTGVTTPIAAYTRVRDKNADNYDPTVEHDGYGYVMIPIETTTGGDAWLESDTIGATINVSAVVGHNETKLEKINNNISNFEIYVAGDAVDCFEGFIDNSTTSSATADDGVWTDESIKHFWSAAVTKSTKSGADPRALASTSAAAATEVKATRLVASAFTSKGDTVYKLPFKTGPKGNENVVYYLQNGITVNGKTAKVRDNDNNYQNVLPVINDAIANYGTITFTFHTAADSIVWTPISGDHSFAKFYCASQWDETYDGDYNAALIDSDVNGDASKLVAVYDSRSWGADGSYKSFTQHLYNGTNDVYASQPGWGGFGGEDYYGGLWGDNNLFGGALVINENRCFALRAKF